MYNSVKIYGGQNINYIWVSGEIFNQNKIDEVNAKKIYIPEWINSTVALATFQNNIEASSLGNVVEEIYGYRIFRREKNSDVLYKVADVDGSSKNIFDFNIRDKHEYQYYIYPVFNTGGTLSCNSPIVTDFIETMWSSWSIVGTIEGKDKNIYHVDEQNIWNFSLNLQNSSTSAVWGKTFVNGYSKHPKSIRTELNSKRGTLTCLIGNIDCGFGYTDTSDMIDAWSEFANNSELKLLKDNKGMIIPCDIESWDFEYEDFLKTPITTLTFTYQQLEDSENISVYGLDKLVV